MSSWTDFINVVVKGAEAAATGDLKNYLTQIDTDTRAFLAQTKTDLQTWTTQLAKGDISRDDFADYVEAEAALAELAALTDAGIGLAVLQGFRDTLIKTVIDAAFAAF